MVAHIRQVHAEGRNDPSGRSLAAIVDWLAQLQCSPMPAKWVPGASIEERRQLAALGKLVGQYWFLRDNTPAWLSGTPAVSAWAQADKRVPDDLLAELSLVIAAGPDAIARLYDLVVHSTARRHLGTFFTPSAEARWMVSRWTELFGSPRSVVDVGAGVGVFTLAAHQAWPTAQIVPVDVNPVTLGLISLLEADTHANSNLLNEHLAPILGDFAAWSQSGFDRLKEPRLILGNPPYTRLQLIPPKDRLALRAAAGDLCGSRASLSALMLGTSLARLKPADGLCFLLPAQWLESNYASGLRNWLWQARHRLVELRLFESRLFQDAQVDAVSLFVGPEQTTSQQFNVSTTTSVASIDSPLASTISRDDSVPSNWRRLFHPAPTFTTELGTPLSELAVVRRGVATGANHYFTLSQDEVDTAMLPRQLLHPFVQRMRNHLGPAVTSRELNSLPGRTRKYIVIMTEHDRSIPSVDTYIARGEAAGLHERHLASQRPLWYALGTEIRLPDLILSASTRSTFSVLKNEAGAAIANNLYGIAWHEQTSPPLREAVFKWLRSNDGQLAMLAASRRQAEGLRKIEVTALQQIIVPHSVLTIDAH